MAALSGCGEPETAAAQPQPAGPTISFAAIESPSMQFLPRQEEVPGWRLIDDPLVYPATRLSRYIDQDARHFHTYEVIDLTVGEYQRVGEDGVAAVEIFRFPDFVKAFGAYSTRRRENAATVEIANEAFLAANSIHVWRGPFYVRVLGAGRSNLVEPMTQLSRAVVAQMPRAPSKPAVFNFFPTANRVANSETYSSEPGFGQPFLANSFTTRFRVDGGLVEGLILPTVSKEAATRVLQQYDHFFRTNGRLLDPIPNLGEGNLTAEDRFFGRTVAFRLDRFVIAFRGFVPRQTLVDLAIATDQRVLNTIRRQLEAADEAAERTSVSAPSAPLP